MSGKRWNWQRWGRATDLIHQSDLNGLVGKFACLEQFRRKKQERSEIGPRVYEKSGGKLTSGNAVHAVLHRILSSPPAVEAMLAPEQHFARGTLERAFDEEFEKYRAGREVDWYKVDADNWRRDCVSMLEGVLETMREHVGEVVAVEAGFVYSINGAWLTGACDIIYRPPGEASLALADWKTGKQKPHQIELDHGWQSGIYSGAMRHGYFVRFENIEAHEGEEHRDALERVCGELAVAWQGLMDATEAASVAELDADSTGEEIAAASRDEHAARDELERVVAEHHAERFEEYPSRIRYVCLQDFIPYQRKGSRLLQRPEELAWAGLPEPAKSAYEKGDRRGPGWYRVNRSEADHVRLSHLLRAVVSWIRFGRFPAAPGEMCSRCRFREPCLLDGYKPIGEERKALEKIMRTLDFDGFEDGLDSI